MTIRRLFLFTIIFALAALQSASGSETQVNALNPPGIRIEEEPSPQLGIELPPVTYPLSPVDQNAFRGNRHGFVNTSLGNLAFRAFQMRLPGRLPLEFGLTYDSAVSESMPPPPVGGFVTEPRANNDLGKNWVLGYSDYLIDSPNGLIMAPDNGDLMYWGELGDGSFLQLLPTPTDHLSLNRIDANTIVEKKLDGTEWTYSLLVGNGTYGLTQIEDRSGNTITVIYNQGFVSRVENSDGAWIEFFRPIFDSNYPYVSYPRSRVTSITDSTGREMLLDYNEAGQLTDVTDVLEKRWIFSYAGNHKLQFATDPLNNQYLSVTYDAQHRVQNYEAQNGLMTFTYNEGGTVVRDALNNTWGYMYQGYGTGVTDITWEPEGGVHVLTLDGNANPSYYQDPEGVTHVWTYDDLRRPSTYLPPGATNPIVFTYDPVTGDVTTSESSSGATTTYTRNAAGLVIEEENELGDLWTSTFASNGDRLTLTLPKGNLPGATGYEWDFGYDAFGSVTSVIDPTDRTFLREYSTRGDLTTVRKPHHFDTTTNEVVYADWIFGRDALGRTTSTTNPLGHTWTTVYDDAGRLIEQNGPAGTSRHYGYDAHHRLVSVTLFDDDVNPTYALFYDDAGRLEEHRTPAGHATHYTHDGNGRLHTVTDPEARTTTYERDLAGRITSIIYPGGWTVEITRDQHGRITDRIYPGGREEHYTYTASGALATAEATETDWVGQIEWTYDVLGRITSVRTEVDHAAAPPEINLVSFTYDPNGNRGTRNTPPTGSHDGQTTYTYDELDRLVTAATQHSGTWTTNYHPHTGNRLSVSVTYQNPVTNRDEDWTYDDADQVVGRSWSFPSDIGEELWSFDAEGRLLTHTTSAGVQSFTWDSLGRLATQAGPGDSASQLAWHYDLDGHRTAVSETAGAATPLVTEFDYNDAGQPTRAMRGSVVRFYSWEDAPAANPAASARLTRSSTSDDEAQLEIDYGPRQRLLSVVGAHIRATEPVELLRNFWSPLDESVALEIQDMDLEGSRVYRRAGMEIGSLYGQTAETPVATVHNFESHVNIIDRSAVGRTLPLGAVVPSPVGPFRLSAWSEVTTSAADLALPLRASSLGAAWNVLTEIRGPEARPTVRQVSPIRGARLDFVDDWLSTALTARIEAETPEPPSPVQPARSACAGRWYCNSEPDANTVQVNVCAGGPPVPLAEQQPGEIDCTAFVQCGIFGPDTCEGGTTQPTCEYAWTDIPLNAPLDNLTLGATSPGGVELMSNSFVETITDIQSYDAYGPITFTRTYRSGTSVKRDLGHRWSHNWDESLQVQIPDSGSPTGCPDRARYISSTGMIVEFWKDEDNEWVGPTDGRYRLVNPRTLVDAIGTRRVFAGNGELQQVITGEHKIEITRSNDPTSGKKILRVLSGPDGGAAVERLFIEYDAPIGQAGRITRVGVRNATGAFLDSVQYAYTPCNELWTVTRPGVTLGWGKDGTQLSTLRTPKTTYTYGSGGGACADITALGYHQLVSIQEAQYEPLTGAQSSYHRVCNVYGQVAGLNPNYGRVVAQCFGQASCTGCTASAADITYSFAPEPGPPTLPQIHTTVLTDYRSGAPIENRYSYRDSFLEQVREDSGSGGLNRTTTYLYGMQGHLLRTTLPDGSCEDTAYEGFWIGKLPVEIRKKTRDRCLDPNADDRDLITRYAYDPNDPFGRVRSITRPEAFTSNDTDNFLIDVTLPGLGVPESPNELPFCLYTTFIEYDYNQVQPPQPEDPPFHNYPPLFADVLSQFDTDDEPVVGPQALGNRNGDSSDDTSWFGVPVRTYQYRPGGNCAPGTEIAALTVVNEQGRTKSRTAPTGVKSLYSYYSDPRTGWDWRGTTPSASADGPGPLAETTIQSTDDPPQTLVSKTAWDGPRAELAASEGPDGVRTEYDRDIDGSVIETRVCNPDTNVEECVTGLGAIPEDHNVLSVSRTTRDLLGRVVRTAVHDGTDQALPAMRVKWNTYDELGQLHTATLDPDPTAVPGAADSDPNSGPLHLLSKTWFRRDGRLEKQVSPARRTICFEYDRLGRQTKTTRRGQLDALSSTMDCPADHADDSTQEVFLDSMGRPWKTLDGRGVARYSWYDGYGRLTASGDGRPPNAPDPILLGGQSVGTVPAASTYQDHLYDTAGHVTRQRFYGSDGHTGSGWLAASWFEFDTLGRPIRTHRAYDASGVLPETVIDLLSIPAPAPTWAATSSVEYGDGDLINATLLERIIDAGSRETDYEYDGFGRRIRTYAPPDEGQRSKAEIQFDGAGRPLRTIETSYGIVAPGDVRNLAVITEALFDAWSRPRGTRVGPGTIDDLREIQLDALGQTVEIWHRWNADGADSPNDERSETIYDAVGRITTTKRLVGNRGAADVWDTTSFTYDLDGLRMTVKDTRAQETAWEYDGLGRVIKVQYPAVSGVRQEIVAGHLVDGTLVDKYDGNGNLLSAEYRESAEATADRLVFRNTYDQWLNLPTERTAEYIGTGAAFLGTDSLAFSYDDTGRLVEAVDTDIELPVLDQQITTKLRYDTLANLRHDQQIVPINGSPVSHVTEADYDNEGFLAHLRYPAHEGSRMELAYERNSAGGLASIRGPSLPDAVNSPAADLVTFKYLGARPLVERLQNGAEKRWYDAAGLLYDAAGRSLAARTVDSEPGNAVLADIRYVFDRIGRPYAEQRLHEPVGSAFRTRLLRSNRAGQLDHWVEGNLSTTAVPSPTVVDPTSAIASPTDLETWTLDPLGNWSEHGRGVGANVTESSFGAANALNQYSSVAIDGGTPKEFEYDWLGQTRTDEASQEKFAWDAFGRMTRVTDLNNTMKSEFRYDALGRRVQRKLNTPIAGDNWIIFLSFGHSVLEERAVSSTFTETPRARYGYKGGLQVAWVDRDVATSAGGAPNPTTGTYTGNLTKRFFVHTDQLGSTIAISELQRDASDQLLVPERYTYTAYGEVTSWTGTWTTGYSDGLRYSRYGLPSLFTGQRQDLQLSSYSFRYRFYDPNSGRFRSRDPLFYVDGLNLYQYAQSAPAALVDSLGLRATRYSVSGETIDDPMDSTGILFNDQRGTVTDNCGSLGVEYRSCAEKNAAEIRQYWLDRHSPKKEGGAAQPAMREHRVFIRPAERKEDCQPPLDYNSGACWAKYNDEDPSESVAVNVHKKIIVVFFTGSGDPHSGPNNLLRRFSRDMASFYLERSTGFRPGHMWRNTANGAAVARKVKEFLHDNPDAIVNVVGWSKGGNSAVQFVNALGEDGISVGSVFLFDPHTGVEVLEEPLALKYGNFDEAFSFYQRDAFWANSGNRFKGEPVQGAYNERFYGETHSSVVSAGLDWLNP